MSVGIVDQALLVDHAEYAEHVALYEEIHNFDAQTKAHGPMVTSILAGKTMGVSPEAEIYYIASSHWNMSITGVKRDGFVRSE